MTFRVLTAELALETNTFNRRVTSAQSFKDRYVLIGDEAFAARGVQLAAVALQKGDTAEALRQPGCTRSQQQYAG